MGYTVDLESWDLQCRSRRDAERAAEVVRQHSAICPYHLEVSVGCRAHPSRDDAWELTIEHFAGDHWHDDEAIALWLALAPHLTPDSTIEFRGEEGDRWRIRWAQETCSACAGQGEVAPGDDGAPFERCGQCSGEGALPHVYEEYIEEVRWSIGRTLEPPQKGSTACP